MALGLTPQFWFQVCTGARCPPFYRYKSWGYKSPPQNNLYRIEVHSFFLTPFSLWNSGAWAHFGQLCIDYRGSFGDLFEGTRTPMFDGCSRVLMDLIWFEIDWNSAELIWTDLIWFDDICWYLNVGCSMAKLSQNYTQFIFERKEGGFSIKWSLLTDLDILIHSL